MRLVEVLFGKLGELSFRFGPILEIFKQNVEFGVLWLLDVQDVLEETIILALRVIAFIYLLRIHKIHL